MRVNESDKQMLILKQFTVQQATVSGNSIKTCNLCFQIREKLRIV